VKEGALKGNSPSDVVQSCDITFACVSDTAALKDVGLYVALLALCGCLYCQNMLSDLCFTWCIFLYDGFPG